MLDALERAFLEFFHRYFTGLPFSALLGSSYLLLPDVAFAVGIFVLLAFTRGQGRRSALATLALAFVTAAAATALLVAAAMLLSMDVPAYVAQHRTSSLQPRVGPPISATGEAPALETSGAATRLAVFLHVSDVHISRKRFPKTRALFERLVKEVLPAVRPEAVLVSGDLTDAKDDPFVGRQDDWEWGEYRALLEAGGWFDPARWIDIRGNHDNFNVSHPCAARGHYASGSVAGAAGACGPGGSRHVARSLATAAGEVWVAALDLAPVPGSQSPFNFFGLATPAALDAWEEADAAGAALTLVVGHYPLATLDHGHARSRRGRPLRALARETTVTAYLFGHLHFDRMLARRRGGLLELGGADLKTKGRFRVLALDHGLLAAAEAALPLAPGGAGPWPLLLVTHPKDAALLSEREPLGLLRRFRHVRVLAFGPGPVAAAHARIDGGPPLALRPAPAPPGGGPPLLVAEFDFGALAPGLHRVEVWARDAAGRTATAGHSFSVDGTAAPMPRSLANLLLALDAPLLALLLLAAALAGPVAALLLFGSAEGTATLVTYAAFLALCPLFVSPRLAGRPGAVYAMGLFYPPPDRPAVPLLWPWGWPRPALAPEGEAVSSADGTRYALSWACFFLAPLAALLLDAPRPSRTLRAAAAAVLALGVHHHSRGPALAYGARDALTCPAWLAAALAAAGTLAAARGPAAA